MAPRPQLHQLLKSLVGEDGKVYFQPPEDISMSYPCIVYEREYLNTQFADDQPYRQTKRYQVTIIDRDPDSPIPDKVAALPMSTFKRFFAREDLNHDIYSLFF